jgi:hypothetical protein
MLFVNLDVALLALVALQYFRLKSRLEYDVVFSTPNQTHLIPRNGLERKYLRAIAN